MVEALGVNATQALTPASVVIFSPLRSILGEPNTNLCLPSAMSPPWAPDLGVGLCLLTQWPGKTQRGRQKWMWSSHVLLSCLQSLGRSGSVCMAILWCFQRAASGNDAASTLPPFTEGSFATCHLVMVDNGNHWIMGVVRYEQSLWAHLWINVTSLED